MARTRTIALVALALAFSAGARPAQARCEGAAEAALLHDAYRAVLVGTGEARKFAGVTLYTLLSQQNAARMARALKGDGAGADPDRLAAVLDHAREIASDAMIGLALPETPSAPHRANVAWLASLVAESGCAAAWSGTGGTPGRPAAETSGATTAGINPRAILGILSAIAFGFAGTRLRRLRSLRARRVERLPRHSTALKCAVRFRRDGRVQTANVTGLDISAGGMKLAWDDPPARGQELELILPGGPKPATIVWANAYYAGIMFDDNLADTELTGLVSIHAPHTASKLGAR